MPVIFNENGIQIRMYFNEHGIPHVHVSTADGKAKVAIRTREIIASNGRIKGSHMAMATAWIADNEAELIDRRNVTNPPR